MEKKMKAMIERLCSKFRFWLSIKVSKSAWVPSIVAIFLHTTQPLMHTRAIITNEGTWVPYC